MPEREANQIWDAGLIGCGEILVQLFLRLRAMQPGELFLLYSRDAAAPIEMPVWCRLTGHKLISANPPEYWIERKGN